MLWTGIWSIDDKLRELPSEYKANMNKAKKSKSKSRDKVASSRGSRGKDSKGKGGWINGDMSDGEVGGSDRKSRSASRRDYLFARGGG